MHAVPRELFKDIDTDSSGGISIQELTAGLKRQGYNINESEVEQLMDRIDMNRDGDIVLDEFAASLMDWSKVVRIPFLPLGLLCPYFSASASSRFSLGSKSLFPCVTSLRVLVNSGSSKGEIQMEQSGSNPPPPPGLLCPFFPSSAL